MHEIDVAESDHFQVEFGDINGLHRGVHAFVKPTPTVFTRPGVPSTPKSAIP